MQTQVEIRKFHAESRIHAARGIWEHLAYSFTLRFVSIYHRLLFALFHYRDAFVNLIELYIVICQTSKTWTVHWTWFRIKWCLFSARSHRSTGYICNVKLSTDFWMKQIIKIGPKKGSIRKSHFEDWHFVFLRWLNIFVMQFTSDC